MKEQKNFWKNYLTLKQVNKVIRIMTFSDIIIVGGFGFVSPIFAVFITDSIKGGSIEVVGIASGVFLVFQSLFQIPIALLIDKIKGEKDDFAALFIGGIIFSLVPLFYLIIDTPWQLYLVQAVYGLATAATLPSWFAIFTRHVDKEHEGIEWGVYRTFVDLSVAFAAFAGGYIAYHYGFKPLFVIVSLSSFLGTLLLLVIYKQMRIGHVIIKK